MKGKRCEELFLALSKKQPNEIASECVDLANIAMMLRENILHRAVKENQT